MTAAKAKGRYDLLVAGGGPSGVAAAAAAAREGLRVLLLEKSGCLGGMATLALVNPFMPYNTYKAPWEENWGDPVNQGMFREILDGLAAMDGLHPNKASFNQEILKLVLDRLMAKYGVDVLFHTLVTGAERAGARVEAVDVFNKSGASRYEASCFVDATGDAELSGYAGCEIMIGRAEDHLCQPMTLCFRIGNVDTETFNRPENRRLMQEKYTELRRSGAIRNPREDVLVFPDTCGGVVHFNSTRIIRRSPVDAADYSRAEAEGREQMYELYLFMKKYVPGFEKSVLLMSASQVGIRESRRVAGEYMVTEQDLLSAVKFPDSVARGTYPVDIHNPDGTGTVLKWVPFGDYYTIPYRALIPKGLDNLLVAGRPISTTHEAHAACRVMPIAACVGEGAGAACSVMVKKGVRARRVAADDIHAILDANGALY